MNYYFEHAGALAPLAVAAITFFGSFLNSFLTRNGDRTKIRSASLVFIDKVINERDWKKRENRIVIEEAFEQLYSKPFSFEEIKILVYSESPNAAFRTYLKYRPRLEINDKRTKFKFQSGKKPYYLIFKQKIKLPLCFIKGCFLYILFALPASYGMSWLSKQGIKVLTIENMVILSVLDVLLWISAIIFLIEGIKYHSSVNELLRDLADKFENN
ncbi:hypothetical protein [Methyloglobulus sp.]|uniref:hypothetical protein n=1 Tax=Methyloglobulus sp. TaxID=2518622 RepID=UPI0032B876E3